MTVQNHPRAYARRYRHCYMLDNNMSATEPSEWGESSLRLCEACFRVHTGKPLRALRQDT